MNLSLIWNRYLWLPLETWNQGVRGGSFPLNTNNFWGQALTSTLKRDKFQGGAATNVNHQQSRLGGLGRCFVEHFRGVGRNVLIWVLGRRSSNRHQQQGREPRSLTTQPPDIRTDASTGSSHQNPHQRSPTTKDQQLSNKDRHKQLKNRTHQTMVIVSPLITQPAPKFTKKSPTTDHSLYNQNQNFWWTFTMT